MGILTRFWEDDAYPRPILHRMLVKCDHKTGKWKSSLSLCYGAFHWESEECNERYEAWNKAWDRFCQMVGRSDWVYLEEETEE